MSGQLLAPTLTPRLGESIPFVPKIQEFEPMFLATKPHLNQLITEDDEPMFWAIMPNLDHLITEDDEPVDNVFSEKQQRLLTEPLYSSWSDPNENRPFWAAANVGVFYSIYESAIVPDVFLALDAKTPTDWWEKGGRSYMNWIHGKPPDVAIEIVSNKKGQETGKKMRIYARMRVPYYAVFDPERQIQSEVFKLYELQANGYVAVKPTVSAQGQTFWWMNAVQLGLTLWENVYEGGQAIWLRWCDEAGRVISTGKERANQEGQRADQEQHEKELALQRADQEQHEKELMAQQLAKLMAQLQALGVEPTAV